MPHQKCFKSHHCGERHNTTAQLVNTDEEMTDTFQITIKNSSINAITTDPFRKQVVIAYGKKPKTPKTTPKPRVSQNIYESLQL